MISRILTFRFQQTDSLGCSLPFERECKAWRTELETGADSNRPNRDQFPIRIAVCGGSNAACQSGKIRTTDVLEGFMANLHGVKPLALALAAAALSACGGGGGSLTPASEVESSVQQTAAPPRNPADYGIFAARGLNLLHIHEIQASNDELAQMVAVAEYGLEDDLHSVLVTKVACHSFVKACDNPSYPLAGSLPFSLYNPRNIEEGKKLAAPLSDDLLEQFPDTIKLVSISIQPGSPAMIERFGTSLPFVVIQSTGNDQRDLFFYAFDPDTREETSIGIIYDPDTGIAVQETGEPVLPDQQRWINNTISAVAADKVLYVSGYRSRAFGRVVRDRRAVGCVGVESACIHAPFEFRLPGSNRIETGTSFSAPNVAMALASVLAYFPSTSGEDLIRLAKTCANEQPNLTGLGIADFTCMTRLDAGGEWRLVSDGDFARLTSPASINSLGFPGAAEVAGNFETARESTRTVRLAAHRPALFHATNFSAGVPQDAYSGETGIFPIAATEDGAQFIGSGLGLEGGFFAAAAYGQSNNFFGLTPELGYGSSDKLDVSLGHDSLFVRATYADSEGTGDLLHSAHGTALGVSARRRIQLTPAVRLDASLHADRFAGGSADTAFGKVEIGESPWNRHADLMMRFKPDSNATYLIGGRVGRKGDGQPQNKIVAGFNYRF